MNPMPSSLQRKIALATGFAGIAAFAAGCGGPDNLETLRKDAEIHDQTIRDGMNRPTHPDTTWITQYFRVVDETKPSVPDGIPLEQDFTLALYDNPEMTCEAGGVAQRWPTGVAKVGDTGYVLSARICRDDRLLSTIGPTYILDP
ncbi:MAG: hypothetical protein V1735_00305 [Nanoarchaeota archaeon]